MTRDEEVYPDAKSFKPERFIKNGVLNKGIRDPRDIVFGFGRRCAFPRLPVLLSTFRPILLFLSSMEKTCAVCGYKLVWFTNLSVR
jgi:hypothetical protein